MTTQSLDGEWQVSRAGSGEWLPATVPGSIHIDLQAAGAIPDPFYGKNEQEVGWVAEADWVYRRTFEPEESLLRHERILLECDGLDTLAAVRLNGEEIARTENMFRRYEFDVTGRLHSGPNTIEIEFSSPVEYARRRVGQNLVITPCDSIQGSPYLRKAMYQWGWDWAPKLPTSGIWRPIRLAGYSCARLGDLRISQLHGRTRVDVHVEAEVERFSDAGLMVRARLVSPDGIVLEEEDNLGTDDSRAQLNFLVENPRLWWPNGHGSQPLYTLEVYLVPASPDEFPEGAVMEQGSGEPRSHITSEIRNVIFSLQKRIGLRKLEVRQEDDRWGRSFAFVVNGVPVFCKGANWIPADHFPARVTTERYRYLIESAARANMNMLRIWGGGIYEDDRFYDLCDEHGILVWQDFMFSCAHYPVSSEMLDSIRLEAIDNVRRVRHHPCLALWCGNNEMEWGLAEWWTDKEERRGEYSEIFHRLLPEVCAEEDPYTLYWPSSPYSGTPFQDPNAESIGDGHYWDVWHGKKPFTAYREYFYRFMSEFGFESLPSMDTVRTFAPPDQLEMTSPVMEAHQKNRAGNMLILYYLEHTFRFPKNFPMMVYASQLIQAEAMRYGVEHWRRNRNDNRCMGALYWQYNDCWPAVSWSGIDYGGRWKALHYYARRFFAPLLLSAEETPSAASLHITNDTREAFDGEVRWSLEDLDGGGVQAGSIPAQVPPGASFRVADLDISHWLDDITRRETVLVYELLRGGERLSLGMVSFVPSKDLQLPEARISVETKEVDGAVQILLSSDKTARYVMLDVPGYAVRFSDNFFDLPSGRPVVVTVEDSAGLSGQEIAGKLQAISLRDSY